MNIRYLQEILSCTEEITAIGKNAKVDGVLCHVMGVVRYGMKMKSLKSRLNFFSIIILLMLKILYLNR